MIVSSDDLIDWVADRDALLIAPSPPQIANTLRWDRPFAQVLVAELHDAMLTTMLQKGTEKEFLGLVAHSNTGLEPRDERAIANRFFSVTLKLTRAASRHVRESRTTIIRFKYGVVVGDGRTDPAHLPLAQVLLTREHVFWKKCHPPFGLECRCSTNLMTQSQFDQSGRPITSEADLAWIEAKLHDTCPTEFRPLLDFRLPIVLSIQPEPVTPLSEDQLNEVLAMFKKER